MSKPLLAVRARLFVRWIGLLVLLMGELFWLTLRFNLLPLVGHVEYRPIAWLFANAGDVLEIGVLVFAFALALLSSRLGTFLPILQEQVDRYRWQPWLLLHILAFGVFTELTELLCVEAAANAQLSVLQLGGWIMLASAMLGCWLLAVAPWRSWLWLGCQTYLRLLAALPLGLAVWMVAPLTERLWPSLADGTLWLAYYVIKLFYPHIIIDPEARILGTSVFQVNIAPQCSGYEGLALIAGFLAIYLWLFRQHLRFPQALLLFPIGMITIWIANGLRISALIAIGSSVSAEVAVDGFHSQAGWIVFTCIALGLVAVTHRARFFTIPPVKPGTMAGIQDLAATPGAAKEVYDSTVNSHLATALLLPFMVLLTMTLLTQAFSSGFDYLYPLRVIVTALVLWYFRKAYRGLGWTWSWQALGIGSLVFLLWIALTPNRATGIDLLAQGLAGIAPWLAATWLIFRVLGSVITVPLAEELVFRGYLLRKLIAQDFEQVHPSQLTWLSFLGSSLLFGLLHSSWLAGTLAGMSYALAYYQRGQIGDAFSAHMLTNALIAAWVFVWKDGSLWMG